MPPFDKAAMDGYACRRQELVDVLTVVGTIKAGATPGTDNVLSLANLAMLTGNVGRECTGVNPLRGQNNVQGACDLGALPKVYSGYQKVDDPAVQERFEKAWKAKLSDKPGLTVVEIMNGAAASKFPRRLPTASPPAPCSSHSISENTPPTPSPFPHSTQSPRSPDSRCARRKSQRRGKCGWALWVVDVHAVYCAFLTAQQGHVIIPTVRRDKCRLRDQK